MANNEFNAKGRRMVYEEDIAKIGEGGGSEYTAGDGISIEEDVISASVGYGVKISGGKIVADPSTVPLLVNNNTFTKTNTFTGALQVLRSNPGISLVSNVSDNKYAQITYQDSNITQSSLRLSTSANNTTRLYSGVAGVEIISGGQTYTFDTTSGGTVAKTSDIKNTIPECPSTTAGTYTLQAVVDSEGNVVYSWVAQI